MQGRFPVEGAVWAPVSALLLASAAAQPQIHGVQFGELCQSPSCVNTPVECLTLVRSADSYGDTFVIDAVWSIIEPVSLNIRVPAAGNLPVASIEGNAVCTNSGGLCQADGTNCQLPCYVGAPLSTLSGLPGVPSDGEVHFRQDQYVIQPGDPNPLRVQANIEVRDLCDSPTTVGCSGIKGSLQFNSVTNWCSDTSPACGGCRLAFQTCMAGPAVPPNPPNPFDSMDCLESFDLDPDERIDLRDFATLQLEFDGE